MLIGELCVGDSTSFGKLVPLEFRMMYDDDGGDDDA
jgi:hypothetical protein